MSVVFLQPLVLAILLALPLLWWLPHRLENGVQGGLRSLTMTLLVLALAQPVMFTEDREGWHVLILDQSASIPYGQRQLLAQAATEWRSRVGDPRRTRVILVGNGASLTSEQAQQLEPATWIDAGVDESALAAALHEAELQVPEGGRADITLVSDGLSTDRRWGPVLADLIRRRIPVNTVVVQRDVNDLAPVVLQVEEPLRVGQSARVVIEVAGTGRGLRVRLSGPDGELATGGPVDVSGRASVSLDFEPRQGGFLPVRVEIEADEGNTDVTNDSLVRTLAVQDDLRVLYAGDRMRGGASRLAELLGDGFTLTDADDVQQIDLEIVDVVVIDDRPASRVPESLQEALLAAIAERGLGLVFSGGQASFGTGGYEDAPIAAALPVEFIQRTERLDPSTALAIIIDTSGSMEGSRIDLAKQVARLAIRRLKAHDRVGIVEFYGASHWALPLQPAANKVTIDRAIGRLQAVGGTVLLPAIEEAYYGLKNIQTRYKHILVLTDAGIEEADYESMIRRVTRDGINLSTVLVGPEAHNQIMIDMASWGQGRFYAASDRFNLPELVLKEPTTTKLPAYRSGSFPVAGRGGEGWWGQVDRATVPALSGYVETVARPGAEVLLEVTGGGHPVLATWRYGLGRVTAVATEPVGPGTESWRDWTDYGRMLGRLITRTANDTPPFSFSIRRNDVFLDVTARRNRVAADVVPYATRVGDDGASLQALEFRELAPGTFHAELLADPAAEIRLIAGVADAPGVSPTRLVSDAHADLSPERQVDPERALDLAALAAVTGGVSAVLELPLPATEPRAGDSAAASLLRMWPPLLLAAMLLYLGELLYRRWPTTT